MPDTKISDLTNLTEANLATGDEFVIVDASAAQTKAITVGEVDNRYLAITQSHNAQVGTSYTLVLADANKLVTLTNASAITLTVPPNSSVAFETGTQIDLAQRGAGAVTVTEGSGVTVNVHADDTLVLDGQYAYATLVKIGTNTWDLFGKLVAA